MYANRRQIRLSSPQDTCGLAQKIAPRLTPGDTILLAGGVGAGKTHFARCAIQAVLDVPEDVPSPTFTLIQVYDTKVGEIWHTDLYRLNQTSELDELGLSQAFTDAICFVEWPDRLVDEAPYSALSLSLDASGGDDTRVATMEWNTARWTTLLREALDD